jgi:iron(III) transport system permease protein
MSMSVAIQAPESFSYRFYAKLRRFFRWLTNPKVYLGLIMLVIMIYLVITPLYRMVMTTLTYQDRDVFRVPEAQVGEFTLFHYARMFLSTMAEPYLYDPLAHSMVISFGATGLAFLIGGSLAWLCTRTDMAGRIIITQLAILPYIMPGWTIAQAWTVLFKNEITGGTSGVFRTTGPHLPGCLMVRCRSSLARHYIITLSFSCL